jgi:teichuronic acid exporter
MSQLRQQAVKSVFWVGSTKTIGNIISLVVTVYLMRILSPVDYGLMGMALSYQAIMVVLYDLGIGVAILQKPDLSEEDIHSAFWCSSMFGIILFGLTWYFAILCGYFYSNDEVVLLIRVLSISVIFLAIQEVPYCLMARRFEFKLRGFAELCSSMICLIISLILAIKGFGVWSLIIGQVCREFFLCVLIMIFSKWKVKMCFRVSNIKILLKFGIPITGQSLLNYFNQSSDSVIIGRFLGQSALGYYQIAVSLAMMPIQKVIVIANKVVFPVFAKIQNNEDMMKSYFYKVFHLISIFAFPVFFGLFSVSEEVVVLILSPKWLPGLFVLQVFCFIAIFRSYIGFLLIVLKAKGNVGAVFRYSLYSSIVLPVGFLIGVNFGISGVAVSWLICFPFLVYYLFSLVKKEIKITIRGTIRSVFHPFVGSSMMLFFVFMVKLTTLKNESISFDSMGICIFTGVIIFLGYFYFFSRDTFSEIRAMAKDLTV